MFRFLPADDPQETDNGSSDSPRTNKPRVESVEGNLSDVHVQQWEPLSIHSSTRFGGENGIEIHYLSYLNQDIAKLLESEQLSSSDLEPGVYEGGFKLWECSLDLCHYLHDITSSFHDKIIVELGCGHGLPGILSLKAKASHVFFQDYNSFVLRHLTLPNVHLNQEFAPTRCTFVSGDWSDPELAHSLTSRGKVDIVLTSETIYCSESVGPLLRLIDSVLSPCGIVLVAAKRYYFGVGGSVKEFLDQVKEGKTLRLVSRHGFEDGKSNIREILRLERY